MMVRIKKLKLVNNRTVRDAIRYMLTYELNKWWVPRQMQAHMWAIGAKISEQDAEEMMEDIFQEAKDLPADRFDRRLMPCSRYKCIACFSPNTSLS